jgi:hypothetical protein
MNPLLSGGLLAASMLLGQTPEPPPKILVPAPPSMQPTQPRQGPIVNFFTREDRPILSRIQSWFKRDQPDANVPNGLQGKDKVIRETTSPPVTTPTPAPGSTDFPRKLPNPSGKAPTTPEPVVKETIPGVKGVEQTTMKPDAGINAKAAKSPLLPYLVDRIGRDEKFEWITGQIEIENGTHVVYYATPETIDKFNGRIVLQPQKVDMTQFRRGDLVSVRGQVVQTKTSQGMVPAYQVTMASLIERAKR